VVPQAPAIGVDARQAAPFAFIEPAFRVLGKQFSILRNTKRARSYPARIAALARRGDDAFALKPLGVLSRRVPRLNFYNGCVGSGSSSGKGANAYTVVYMSWFANSAVGATNPIKIQATIEGNDRLARYFTTDPCFRLASNGTIYSRMLEQWSHAEGV
jgi:hypothetical protein